MKYRSSRETNKKILSLLVKNGEYAQYDIPKKIDRSYRTVVRHLQTQEKQGFIRLARTEPAEKGGKDKKIYTPTHKGVLSYLTFTSSLNRLRTVIKNYPETCLVFEKWGLFRKAGIEEKMLRYLKEAITTQRWVWPQIFADFPPQEDPEDRIKERINNVLYVVIVDDRDEEVAKVCKEDKELKDYVDGKFGEVEDGIKRLLEDKEWWENFQAA